MNRFRRVAGCLLLQPRFVAAGGGGELAADAFNRADESPLAAPWVTAPNWNNLHLTGNAVGGQNGSVAYYSGVSFPANQYARARWSGIGTPNGGPAVRVNTSNGSCYFASTYSDGTLSIYLWTLAGGYQQLAVQNLGAWAGNDVVDLRANGTSLTASKNGTPSVFVTDSTLSSGEAGLFIYPISDRWDDWSAGSI